MSTDPDQAAEQAFRDALSEALAASAKDQKDVAVDCGMTPQTLTNLKRGKTTPSFKALRGLVAGLQLDPWKALDVPPPAPLAPQPATPSAADQVPRDILADLVAAAEGMRAHAPDLIDAFRRAEDYVRQDVDG